MTRNQDIRAEIMMQLYAARPVSLAPVMIARQAQKSGLDFTGREVAAECVYLSDEKLVEKITDQVQGVDRYRITSAGVRTQEVGT